MFRKGREKLQRLKSDEGAPKYTEKEESSLNSTDDPPPTILAERPFDYHRKRASEPVISYRPSLAGEHEDQSQQIISTLSSGLPDAGRTLAYHSAVNEPGLGNPLGLTLISTCATPEVDFIFVHGLGGTSIGSWCVDHNSQNFWLPWLTTDNVLSKARIFTYGYNAQFTGPRTNLNILDFAQTLLSWMESFSPEPGPGISQGLGIGKLPTIFVAHSMGGLVVKKAYIIGKSNPQYTNLVSSIRAIVFLATPHRGSDYASMLQNILRITPGVSGKVYVAELEKISNTLQDINEQFRHICEPLRLVSFHETLKTSVPGLGKIMVVDKDSAHLEYPGETIASLDGDHRDMAKFKTPHDSNYLHVKNRLSRLMTEIVGDASIVAGGSLEPRLLDVQPDTNLSTRERLLGILGIPENFEDDYESISSKLALKSCQWLLEKDFFQEWIANTADFPDLLWLIGNPGSGKSTLASFVIQTIKRKSGPGTCQFHFSIFGNQSRRTTSYILRNIALQIACHHQNFYIKLLQLYNTSKIDFKEQKSSIIWEKIFEGILFRIPLHGSLFWVLDGLDEAESPLELMRYLSKIKSMTQIKILLLSRPRRDLAQSFKIHFPGVLPRNIRPEDTSVDIRNYVLAFIQQNLDFEGKAQTEIADEIHSKSKGSFLWVKLALNRINNCHLVGEVKAAIEELPKEMEPLYKHMIGLIASQELRIREIATQILSWTACASRPLSIPELEVALHPLFGKFLNLERTVQEACGLFVEVNKGQVRMIHHTARSFILHRTATLPVKIRENPTHQHLAIVCMEFLSDWHKWRRVFSAIHQAQQLNPSQPTSELFAPYPFLLYSLSYWAYHMSLAPAGSEEFLLRVLEFLEGFCLLWIHGIAISQKLQSLVLASSQLKAYAQKRALEASENPLENLSISRHGELLSWANDISRLVRRFGNNLAQTPSSIHREVIPFCPKNSIISQTFAAVQSATFSVTGLSSSGWSDCLAKLTMDEDQTALQILCKDIYFLTLVGINGTVIVWYADTCQEARRFTHGEYVTQISNSKTSNYVSTAGPESIKVWDITTGQERYNIEKNPRYHTRAMAFGKKDDEILIAYDNCLIECIDLATYESKWRFVAKEPNTTNHNCPRYVSFSPDLTQVALVFRGRPVVVWTIQPGIDGKTHTFIPPKRCIIHQDKMRTAAEGDAWDPPEIALWHPVTDHLLVLYEDTRVVEWNITDDKHRQFGHTAARAMVLSPDGNLLLTSDVNGTLSLWSLPEYQLTFRLKYDELVTDLAFSPDSSRFYDLRGLFCNIWEPDALVRATQLESAEYGSSHESTSVHEIVDPDAMPLTSDANHVLVTALASESSDRYYCCGKEDGSLAIHGIPDGEIVRKLSGHSSSVSIIAWSSSLKYLFSADDSGLVIGKRIEPPTEDKPRWAVYPLFEIRLEDSASVETFLIHPKDHYLLISTQSTTLIISLSPKSKGKEVCKAEFETEGVWLNHPKDPSTLVRIEAENESLYAWSTLQGLAEANKTPQNKATVPGHPDFTKRSSKILRAVQAQDYAVVESMRRVAKFSFSKSNQSSNRKIALFKFDGGLEGPGRTRRYEIDGLAQYVYQLVGETNEHIVFLDHQFWLCTWEIEATYTKHERHFFLPRDWISPLTLSLMVLNQRGTLLVPKIDEVAIIRSGLKG